MPEVAPVAVGTHLVVGDPPTQSLSQLLVPRTTMFGSFGGGSQHSLQRPRPRVLCFVILAGLQVPGWPLLANVMTEEGLSNG